MSNNLCRRSWFNPDSRDDQVLTTYDTPLESFEVDNLEALKIIRSDKWSPKNEFVIFQQWGPVETDGSRTYFWFDQKTAYEVGKIVKNSTVHKLILIFTTIEPGALETFAKMLPPGQLEFLGLFWALSGDNIVDGMPDIASEIVAATNHLHLSRLSILTLKFDEKTENLLAEALKEKSSLKKVEIFKRVNNDKYSRFEMPNINAEIENR